MPCYLRRASRLGMKVPQDSGFEQELMKALKAKSHEEMRGKIEAMSDWEFAALIQEIMRRRKRAAERNLEEHSEGVEALPYA